MPSALLIARRFHPHQGRLTFQRFPMRLFRSLVSYSLLITSISLPLAEASPADFNDLKEKAEKGNYVAQYNLGLAYIDGSDTSVNLVEAYYWLTIAVDNADRGKALAVVYVVITPYQHSAPRELFAEDLFPYAQA